MTDEIWKPIVGYEGLYEVSDHGRVRSFVICSKTGNRPGPHLMKLLVRKRDGYQTVGLTKNGVRTVKKVHQLVSAAFLPARPSAKHEPDHVNGVRTDNRADNLRWLTRMRNLWNCHTVRSESGVLGVYRSDKKNKPWRAAIMRNRVRKTLGHFTTVEEAFAARKAAEDKALAS